MPTYVYTGNELYHHGIKGMRWGVRRFQRADGSLTPAGKKRYDAKEEYKQARKDYDQAWDAYSRRSHQAYSFSKKKRQANEQRLNEAMDKAEKMNAAKDKYKKAKQAHKDEIKAENQKRDDAIREARQKEGEMKKEAVSQAKNFVLATMSGDKETKVASTRKLANIADSYMDNKKVAESATSGEKKAAAIMAAGVGTITVAAYVAGKYRGY